MIFVTAAESKSEWCKITMVLSSLVKEGGNSWGLEKIL